MPTDTDNGREFDVYHLYDSFRKRIILLVGIILVGVILGFVITKAMNNKYEVSVLATSTVLKNHESAKLISKLKKIISENDMEALSNALNKPRDSVNTLKDIKIIPSDDDPFNFEIQLVTTNPATAHALLDGIQNYYQKSKYPKQLKSVRKKSLERIVNDYKKKLRNLDSLQTNIFQAIGGKKTLSTPLIVSDIYSDYTTVRSRLEGNMKKLQLLSILEYYEDPYISQSPDSPKLIINLTIAFVVSSVVAIFLVVFLSMVDFFKQNAPQNRN